MSVEVREDGLVAVTVDVEGPQGIVAHDSVMTADQARELADEIHAALEAGPPEPEQVSEAQGDPDVGPVPEPAALEPAETPSGPPTSAPAATPGPTSSPAPSPSSSDATPSAGDAPADAPSDTPTPNEEGAS